MATFTQSEITQLNHLNESIQNTAETANSLEAAAQSLVEAVYETFEESSVLVRLYGNVACGDLPDFNRNFVSNLVEAKGVSDDLKDNTQVLSLLGTCGKESDWKDRMKSQGHVGIPLVSSGFVDQIPMIARLLQQIGIGLNWIDTEDIKIVAENASTLSGMFYVADAATEEDSQGRKIIPMQDFVSQYGVKTVFGFGSGYSNGMIVVLVVFTNESVPESKAKIFEPLISTFKGNTVALATSGKVFN